MHARRIRTALVAAAVIGVMALGGCGLLSPWRDTTSVSDPGNLFHVKVPTTWQTDTTAGFIFAYADKDLPEDTDRPEALSLLIFGSNEASSAPVPEMLNYLIDARAETRGWTNVVKGDIIETEVGGRPAVYIEVTADDADGTTFEGRYYFVRTGSVEAFMAAIAPAGEAISAFDADLTRVTEEWYWHTEESSATPAPEDTSRQP